MSFTHTIKFTEGNVDVGAKEKVARGVVVFRGQQKAAFESFSGLRNELVDQLEFDETLLTRSPSLTVPV